MGTLWTKMGLIAATPPAALVGTEYAHRPAEAVASSAATGACIDEANASGHRMPGASTSDYAQHFQPINGRSVGLLKRMARWVG